MAMAGTNGTAPMPSVRAISMDRAAGAVISRRSAQNASNAVRKAA
jgi:hypothetical protein